jgi:uncharacterized protein YndB with AHSA1/START domain
MPHFDDAATSSAPVEEVWKLLYDPSRFPEWWSGLGSVDPRAHDGQGDYTMYLDGYPDFPMPQELRGDVDGRQVTISCLVSDLEFAWRLRPLGGDGGEGTEIAVHVELPEEEAHRLETQRTVVRASLEALATLATA